MKGAEHKDVSVMSGSPSSRRGTPATGVRGASEGTQPTPVHPVVVKLGGRSLEAPGASRELAAEVASLSGGAVLVHGGGREVSDWCARLGIESRFEGGLRVTDEATLEVAVAVLAGLANARLVAALRDAGVDAVGLNALDGVADVAPHPDAVRLGAVGVITRVHAQILEALLAQGRVPVIASIGAHAGALLNVNADSLAGSLAPALHARALVLLSDVPGLALEGGLVARLSVAEADAARAHQDVRDGMLPKLKAAHRAVAGGVAAAHIAAWTGPGSLAAILNGNGCTTIAAPPDGNGNGVVHG